MLTDYHTHTYRCGHAIGTMNQYIEAAIAKGIEEIGLSDHLYLYYEPWLRGIELRSGHRVSGLRWHQIMLAPVQDVIQ